MGDTENIQSELMERTASEYRSLKRWEKGKYLTGFISASAGLYGIQLMVETGENQPRAWASSAGLIAISGICHFVERHKQDVLIEDEHRLLILDPNREW